MELVDRRFVIPARGWRESSAIPLVQSTTNRHGAARNEQAGFPTQALGNDEIWAYSVVRYNAMPLDEYSAFHRTQPPMEGLGETGALALFEPRDELWQRHRFGDQKSLYNIATQCLHQGQILRVFYPFSNGD